MSDETTGDDVTTDEGTTTSADEGTELEGIPDKEIDSAHTRTDDQPGSLKPVHSANVGAWQELTTGDPEPVLVAERQGMFGARSQDTTGYGGVVQPVLFPGATPRPYGSFFDEVADQLATALASGDGGVDAAVERVVVDRGELTIFVRREHLPAVARAMRDVPALRFEMCLGVSGVHFPEQQGRELHAVYHLLSITHGSRRVRLEVTAPDDDPHVPSIVSVYPGDRLARARDLGHVRHRLRRPPGPDAHPHARRLAGPPAAQGLPARRHPRRVQGRHRPAARRAEGVQLMTTHDQDTTVFEARDGDEPFGARDATPDAYGSPTEEGLEGVPVFNVSGGDWNDLVDEATALNEERIVVNMGPQHPSTHGVLRLILELDGETVTEARAGIGYLHTGIEKNMEFRTWVQGVTFCTRMDYLTPMMNEAAYCLSVERLLGIEDRIPERASIIRVHDDGAHPHQLPPRGARHRRHGARRDDGHDRGLP